MDKRTEDYFIKKIKVMAGFLAVIPFIEAIILNGSLAQKKATNVSDIDILIISSNKRIWTVRLLVNFLAIISFQKRSKDEGRGHAKKFCFNYFLTSGFLKIPVGRGEEIDSYCADNYSQSVLIWGDTKLFENFLNDNKALFLKTSKTYPNRQFDSVFPLARSFVGTYIKNSFEKYLKNSIGDRLEAWAKQFQLKKINLDERTKRYPKYIVCSDHELRFHPPKKRNLSS